MTTLSYADRHALGLRARQQLARSAHAALNASACPADPIAVLTEAMKGRIPELLKLKYKHMAESPFTFLRGAVPIMAADLACQPHTGILTQLCGDAHVENLGAYESADGRLTFDINDFDETVHGPFEWDVKRLATSLLLAGREAGIKRADRRAAVGVFTARYRRAMREFAQMPVIEMARWQIHRLRHAQPMPQIMRQAERCTPGRNLEKLTEPGVPAWHATMAAHSGTRRIDISKRGKAAAAAAHTEASAPEASAGTQRSPRRFRDLANMRLLDAAEAGKVLGALDGYAKTLPPERQHFLAQYDPVDVAFKVVGTGSLGLYDYVVYLEGHARPEHTDPLFLQVKEEPKSAYARYLKEEGSAYSNQGHRVMDGQRAMQLTSDPFLGYTRIDSRDFLVRQLNDHKASLNMETMTATTLRGYASLCGELLARGHARSGDPVVIAAYVGSSGRFDGAILDFAHVYADKTERDLKALKQWRKKTQSAAR